jgi:hypothetical protein
MAIEGGRPTKPSRHLLYRVVVTAQPTVRDFMSNAALGRPLLDPTPEKRRLWSGLSFWATAAQARRSARRFRNQGDFVAIVEIGLDDQFRIEKTRGPGHYTVWGLPHALLERVVSVEPV